MLQTVKQAQAPTRNWYRDALPEDRREYDAFGPWITEVKSDEDMPKRFRFALPRYRDARYLLKIPRDAERQKMRPGMDLYVAVLALTEDGACLMRLVGGEVLSREIVWSDVVAVRNMTNLLVGRWTLLLDDSGEMSIDYNTVSARLMEQVTDFVRDRVAWKSPMADLAEPPTPVSVTDHLYEYMLYFLLRSGPQPVVPVHFEPADRRCRNEAGRRRLTTGLMILDAPNELILVNRDEPMRTLFQPNYAVVSTTIPYEKLTSFALESPPPDSVYRFHTLVLVLGQQVIRQACLSAPEAVMQLLTERGIARH